MGDAGDASQPGGPSKEGPADLVLHVYVYMVTYYYVYAERFQNVCLAVL